MVPIRSGNDLGIRHAKVSAVADGGITSKVRPSDWNADHIDTNVFNVKDTTYGAIGNGIANDSTAIQSAIDACTAAGGGTAYAPPGTYLINTALALKSNVKLLGAGPGTVFQKADGNSGTATIQASGTLGTTVALTGTPTYGSISVTAATNPATLVRGDFVLIRDTQYTNTTFGRNQELNRVVGVSGSGPFTYTLANRLLGTYLTGSSAEMLKLTPVNSARVESLKITVPGNAPTTVVQHGGGIYFDLGYDCYVRDVDIAGAYEMPAIRMDRSAHIIVFGCDIRDGQDITNGSGYGYGIGVGESSHDVIITHSYMENIRENDFTNNARNCIFSNNDVRTTQIHAISTHGAGGGRMVIANNNIHGSTANGVTLHNNTLGIDTDILVTGNYFEDYGNYAISIGANAAPGSLLAVNIVGNYFGACRGTGDGYQVGVGNVVQQVTIRSNTFDNTNGASLNAGLLINNNSTATAIVDTVVEGNDFRNITGMGIYLGKATRTIIRNNHFTAVSSYNIDSNTLGGGIDSWVYGNTADDATVNKLAADRWWNNAWGSAAAGLAQNPRVFALASNHGISSTSATEVTGLGPCTLEPGTYTYEFSLITQSATTSVGIGLGINFTGTAATRTIMMSYPSTATSTSTGVFDDVGAGTGQYVEHNVQTAFSTTSPNMINTNGYANTTANVPVTIKGVLVVTVAGDLELWHGSETNTSTTVIAGSVLVVTRAS